MSQNNVVIIAGGTQKKTNKLSKRFWMEII